VRAGTALTVLAAAAVRAAAPAGGRALEPRYDHRDQLGVVAEVDASRVTATTGGGLSRSAFDLASLRLAFSFDVGDDGNEILVGGSWSPASSGEVALTAWSVDARYRGFFGTDELKTFFDAGLLVAVSPRVAAGPRVGFGVMYDLDRAWGIFASLGASTAFGEFRGFGIGVGIGVQIRWPS
jgi:hypothetical protein